MSGQAKNGTIGGGHLSEAQMDAYLHHDLAAGELLSVDGHLGGCAGCRRILRSRMKSVALPEEVLAMSDPLHLSYEQIAAYIDGALAGADKERVEAHKFLCSSCDREIKDMERFEAQLAAAPAKVPAKAVERISLQTRIAQFFAPPGRVREFGLSFGAVIAGFFVILQADRTPGNQVQGSGQAARLFHLGASAHPGLDLGGFLLMAAGLVYLAYSIWKKR